MEKNLILLILGVIGLWVGSGISVDYTKKLAESLKVSTLIIGLTVTSIGTSLGEIMTNIIGGYQRLHGVETSGISLGTVMGSNISLITFVLGFCGFFTVYYIKGTKSKGNINNDWLMLFLAISLMFIFSLDDKKIDFFEAIIMISVYGAYLYSVFKREDVFEKVTNNQNNKHKIKWTVNLILIFIGIAIVIYAADLVIDNSIIIANKFQIKKELIGILIGFGTSLPELTISLNSLYQKAHGLSLGNLIGSNITDPLLSLGIGSIISPTLVDEITLFFDIPFMFIVTLIAWLFFLRGGKLDKVESSILVCFYFIFVYFKFFVIT